MSDPSPSLVLRRQLASGTPGGLPLLDAVLCPDRGNGPELRLFSRSGVTPAAFDTAPPEGAPPREVREVSGSVMAVAAPGPIALAGGSSAEVDAGQAEWDLLAGRNCLLAFRLEEGAGTVADWLAYHAAHHGATGAVIVNRAPPDSPAGGEGNAGAIAERTLDEPHRPPAVPPAGPICAGPLLPTELPPQLTPSDVALSALNGL